MSKRKAVVCARAESLCNVAELQFNWEICCICQSGIDDPLTCPADNPIASIRNQGYVTIASNLTQLISYDYKLPCGRNIRVLDEGDGVEDCLMKHKARWHKSCALKFSKPRFTTLLSSLKKSAIETDYSSPESEQNNAARPKTRSLTSPVGMKDLKCFLCLGPETRKHQLCLCATKEVTEKVKLCASALRETRIMGMLETGGDLVAMEAKYHKNCLSQLYNRYRVLVGGRNPEKENTVFCENIAFAELILYIENKLACDVQYVFDMGSISKTYHTRIADLNKVKEEEISMEHTTRLREKLLTYFPTLTAEKWGNRYVLKSLTANLMPNILREDQDDDALAFHRFTKSLRKSISSNKVEFDGAFPENCEEKCIPGPLLAAVSTLLYGSTSSDYSGARRPVITICQLIMLNFHEGLPNGDVVRHKKHREPPLPLYMGLSCYGRSRDKALIDLMHREGVSVSSNRIFEVTSQLCRLVVKRASDESVVCPSNLKKSIFTVTALDNIDFKSKSNTISTEFHGTGISVFQCPTKENEGQTIEFVTSFNDVRREGDRSVPNLPGFYSNVPDCILTDGSPLPPSVQGDVGILEMVSTGHISKQWKKEEPWLRSLREHLNDTSDQQKVNFSWSSFHATLELEKSDNTRRPAINALLPLFHEKSTSTGMIKHGMNIVRELTKYLNGDQVPVICLDQQLYVIAKKIQWHWPVEYGENKYVVLLGPLHIEQSFLRVLGQLMEDSGWTAIISHSGICPSGSAEALLKVTHIKRAREMHQITAAVLYSLVVDEYERRCPDEELSFDEWLDESAKVSPTFKFWLTVLNLEVTLLSFVRSLRLGNYVDFRDSMKQMIPWYFVFDHQNYSRWLPVHIMDLEQLEHTAPDVHTEFLKGHFVVNKTTNVFSGLGVDHAHEQNNAVVKGKGGVVGLTHDPCSLRRWTIGGPEISRLLNEFEGWDSEDQFGYHHEQKECYQLRFLEYSIALKDAFLEFDNPFSIEGPELLALDTRAAISEEGVSCLKNAEEKGSLMYTNFVSERLLNKTKSIYDPIQKCKTKIFAAAKKSVKSTIKTLKSDLNLFSRSFIVSVSRNLDLDLFFAHENQEFPPSLSLNGEIRSGDKMQLTLLLEKLIACTDAAGQFPSNFDGVIIDGAVMVHSVKPRPDIKSFTDYASQIENHIGFLVRNHGAKRVDIAWDLYLPNSLKQSTRTGRGAGLRRIDLPAKDRLPTDWADYLRNDSNKGELFRFLGRALLNKCKDIQFVTNVDATITASSPATTALHGVCCGNMEEADGRIVLHLQDAVENAGAQNMLVRSSDTDVLVILISFYPEMRKKGLQQLWLQYGVGSKRRYISVHRISEVLGDDKAVALRGFHAFSGCDFTSFFSGKGKRSAWAAWDDSVTAAFKQISQPIQGEINETVCADLEKFTVKLYGVREENEMGLPGINQARKHMFASESKHISAIPPTQAALLEHIKRAAYVAGHIWGRANHREGTTTTPQGWGWTRVGDEWKVVWSKLPEVWKAVRALDRCGCGTGCQTLRCCCRRNGMPCSPACRICKGDCGNRSGGLSNDDDDIDFLGDP